MKRRSFITQSMMAMAAPSFIEGSPLDFNLQPLFLRNGPVNDKVLVLINLQGGNDGLNTFVPIDQFDQLAKARKNILLPENKLLNFLPDLKLHPSLEKVQELSKNGRLGVVQNVGYPNPNFSHFRSTDIITSSSDSNVIEETGWLGRFINTTHTEYPKAYPNNDFEDPLAITFGSNLLPTCQGFSNNMGVAINGAVNEYSGIFLTDQSDSAFGKEVEYIRTLQTQTQAYLKVIKEKYQKGQNLGGKYVPDGSNALSKNLKAVAKMISGGVKTSVYILSVGGFDTHGSQVAGNDTTKGKHAELLQTLSDAVYGFQSDLKAQGLEDRVLTMTFTEFGRRISSNGGKGTDHGEASPTMLFGSQVNPIVLGENYVITDEVVRKKNSNVPMEYDFRSVYASVLRDWLGASESEIKDFLFGEFEYLPILKKEGMSKDDPGNEIPRETGDNAKILGIEDEASNVIKIYPNPSTRGPVNLKIQMDNTPTKIKVLSSDGRVFDQKSIRFNRKKVIDHTLDTHNWAVGTYLVRVETMKQVITKRLILIE